MNALEALTPITGEFSTVLDLFDEVVRSHGDREAFVHPGVRITFNE